ncbi:hypothetical protein H0H92_007451 [Tricholoma furcatifolium]|nr:hypothetical protein H0H92_007451 [Tricholoma furcatifolium]
MARATRSTKRKRNDDDADDGDKDFLNDDQPPQKIVRHDNTVERDTAAILDVLDMIDTQGLLDRVFPVHGHADRSSSLRALLIAKEPLNVLRAAIVHLQPISSHPRSKSSSTATQQHRFCALATSLLNTPSDILPRQTKYALVQHLPNQDYWSSLNDNDTDTDPKLLSTAHAELAAILPTPQQDNKYPVPTLAAYATTRPFPSIKALPQHRTVTSGSFLDFGPWASFAPCFDHDGEVVGRAELGQVLYASHERRKKRSAAAAAATAAYRGSIEEVEVVEKSSVPGPSDGCDASGSATVDLEKELRELLPLEEAEGVKAALDSLELERAVHELLDRNRRALLRLEQLQVERFVKDGVNAGAADEAQGILETLTVLASLRPRTSKSPNSIVPPPGILHKLHRTLAVEAMPGWHGTLPATRPAALADDTTFKKSSRVIVPAPTPTPAAPAPVAPVTATAPVAMPYSGYTYAYGQQGQGQPYRPASASTTAGVNGQTTPYGQYAQYYGYAAAAAAAGQAGQGQQGAYYSQQQQGYAAAAAASYSSWYYSQQQQQQQQQQGGSGSSTPQGAYGSFFGRTPAVANTVYGQYYSSNK